MPENDIQLEERETGNKVTVTLAYYRRWKSSLDVSFRPVAEKKTTPKSAAVLPEIVGSEE